MITLTAKTTDIQICNLSKSDLIDLYDNTTGVVVKKLKKDDLVLAIKNRRDNLRAIEDKKAKEAETSRLQILESEKRDERINGIFQSLATSLTKQVNAQNAILTEIQGRMTKGLGEMVHAMEWRTNEAFRAWSLLGRIANLSKWITNECETRTVTLAELIARINELSNEATCRCLESSEYESRSTSPMVNFQGQCEFKAAQQYAKLMRQISQWLPKVAASESDARLLQYCSI